MPSRAPLKSRSIIKRLGMPEGLALGEHTLGPLGSDDVLVKVHFAAICGTDLHLYKWNDWAARSYRPPFPLGHEFAGEIIEAGAAVTALAPGDRVVAETHLACGVCDQCRANRRHTCLNLKVFSKLGRGCFSHYTTVPQQALGRIPDQLDFRTAVVMEPLSVSVQAIMEVDVRARRILIVGCGPIGLFAILAASALGAAEILAVDPVSFRRRLAETVGARRAVESVDDLPGGSDQSDSSIDIALDSSGHPGAIRSAMKQLRPGGSLVITSLPDQEVPIDFARHIVLREISIRGVYGRLIDETWLQVERLLTSGAINVDPVLTHTYRLVDFQEAFEMAASGEAGKVPFKLD